MKEKLEALASIIADYREGEIPKPDADHVGKWIAQFDPEEQEPLLDELCHVWSGLYLSKEKARRRLATLIAPGGLAGANPKAFWSGVSVLDIQQNGESQRELNKLLDAELKRATGLTLDKCGGTGTFAYLDDVLFTGFRLGNDIEAWLPSAPAEARVHVCLFGYHTFGREKAEERLKRVIAAAGKRIEIVFTKGAVALENHRQNRTFADVLWPTELPPEAEGFDQGDYPFLPRKPVNHTGRFSSDARRHVMEQAFLKAGFRIRSFPENPSASLRPLGFGPFAVGFGSLVLTWRNCPNNAPLALWWGDPTKPSSHPLSKWYPLVPRRTYGGDDDL